MITDVNIISFIEDHNKKLESNGHQPMFDVNWIKSVRCAADAIHESVNQSYGDGPYLDHLDYVALNAVKAVAEAFDNGMIDNAETLPYIKVIIFGCYFHDTIEDARLTYNDVLKQTVKFFNEFSVQHLAADIVYALTDEKGKTREERHNDKYYTCIQSILFAPFVKMCDICANAEYSKRTKSGMFAKYKKEWENKNQDFFAMCAREKEEIMSPIKKIIYCKLNQLFA